MVNLKYDFWNGLQIKIIIKWFVIIKLPQFKIGVVGSLAKCIMAWLFTEYDVARNFKTLACTVPKLQEALDSVSHPPTDKPKAIKCLFQNREEMLHVT